VGRDELLDVGHPPEGVPPLVVGDDQDDAGLGRRVCRDRWGGEDGEDGERDEREEAGAQASKDRSA